jgi:hypothetical protein
MQGCPYKTLDVLRSNPALAWKEIIPPLISASMSSSSPEPNEVGDFELNLTGGVPGPTSQDLECEIKDSPCPVVLHIEASFKVPWEGGWEPGSW